MYLRKLLGGRFKRVLNGKNKARGYNA